MRIVCLSDTHDAFRGLEVPPGDLLVHGGDLSRRGRIEEVEASAEWLRSLPHRHKIVIAGNHDFCLEREDPRALLQGLTYLQDEGCEVEGLRVYGSPWTPAHGLWSFQAERGEPLSSIWQQIPAGVDLLVTHGPPRGILDRHVSGSNLGCEDLRQRVEQVKPKLHVFGHVHESHGTYRSPHTLYVNACNCSFGYKRQQPPVVVDWVDGTLTVQEVAEAARAEPLLLETWELLIGKHGTPREVRYLPAAEQRRELEAGTVFWLEISADGRVGFRPAAADEDVTDRGPDHTLRRWAFTLGVKVSSEWLEPLNANPWANYTQIPHLPD